MSIDGLNARPMRRELLNKPHRPPIDLRAAAAYLGTSERHLRRLRTERRVACIKLGGKVLFAPDDLDRFLEQCREPAIDDRFTSAQLRRRMRA